jgi:hypothetical protein
LTKNQETQAPISNNPPPPEAESCPLPSPQFVPATQYPSVVLPSSPNQTLIQEMLAALQPALDAISLKLELGLKTLKADLLEEMANLKDEISNQDSKIAALQARLQSSPTPAVNPPAPLDIALPEASSLPPRPVAFHKPVGKINQAPLWSSPRQLLYSVWTTVSSKKKTVIKAPLTDAQTTKTTKSSSAKPTSHIYRTEQEVVIEFEKLRLPIALTCNSARNVVNKMLIDRKDVFTPPFISARFSRNNNLVLTTPPTKNNFEYETYLGLICEALPLQEKELLISMKNGLNSSLIGSQPEPKSQTFKLSFS